MPLKTRKMDKSLEEPPLGEAEKEPQTQTKQKVASPQKASQTIFTPNTRGVKTRQKATVTYSIDDNVQATDITSLIVPDETNSPTGTKAKRGRPRTAAVPAAEKTSPNDVGKSSNKESENSSAVPPKKRKGIRIAQDESNEGTDHSIVDKLVPEVGEVAAGAEVVGEQNEIQPLEISQDEDNEDNMDTGDNPTTSTEETPSQKANIKSQRKKNSDDIMPSNILQCPLCKSFCVQLVRHLRTHHGEHEDLQSMIKEARTMEQKAQPKEPAGKTTKRQQLVRPKNVQCPLCLKVVRRYDFNKHVRNVHSGEKPNKCPHCDYSSPWKGNLTTHIKGVHTKERNHQCPSCSLAFKTRGALIGHVRKIHEGMYQIKERPFECETCHKMFFKKYHLERHVRIHTGEKPFNCVFCEKKFTSKTNLDTHVQSIHLKIRPFKCGFCERGFLRKKQLVDHIQNHHVSPGSKKPVQRTKRKTKDDLVDGDDQAVTIGDNETVVRVPNEVLGTAEVSKDTSQTIIWRVQLPDGSQELHIRTCESEQTPQVLLIPQNHTGNGGEGDVIVLQPVQAKPSDIKMKPITSHALQPLQPGERRLAVMPQQNDGEAANIVDTENIEQNDDQNQTLITASELASHHEVLQESSSLSSLVAETVQQAVGNEQTDGGDDIHQAITDANLHIIQGQDSNEGITISVLSPDQVAQSQVEGGTEVPVMLPSTSQDLSSHIIDVTQAEALADNQSPQEYFFQTMPPGWQYNQTSQAFQHFPTNSTYHYEVHPNNTFTTPSVPAQYTTFANNGQTFTPVEPQPCGDLPQNFNVHSMEKTYQTIVSQAEQFNDNLPLETVPVSAGETMHIVREVQDQGQDQDNFFG